MKPWADPGHESYSVSRRKGRHRCLGCGKDCTYTAWGPWCFACNVERMERINKSMAQIARAIGDDEIADELERD